jgi:hypothetical protein
MSDPLPAILHIYLPPSQFSPKSLGEGSDPRRLAQECLAMARTVSTEEGRAVLIDRAEFWFRLAKEQEEERANVETPAPPAAAGESQQVAQQQQQVQPKDDDKKE